MELKLKEISTLMLKILRDRSQSDPLCRQEIAKLLILYRDIYIEGEIYLDLWWERFKETLPKEELELLGILHQALLYRIQDEEQRLEEQAEQREIEVEELLSNLEEEIMKRKIANGDINIEEI